jgi:hypothetical protein
MLTMKYVDSTDILDYFGLYTMGFTPKLAIKSIKQTVVLSSGTGRASF